MSPSEFSAAAPNLRCGAKFPPRRQISAAALASPLPPAPNVMRLADLLNPNAVRTPLLATEKQSAINELVDAIAACSGCSDSDAVKRAVWERESQRSTGIGEGLAIPHGKSAAVNELSLAIGKPTQPMEFGSIDKKPVRLIVLLISRPEKKDEHIQALGKISKIMSSPQFRQLAYAATEPAELYDLFIRAHS